MRFEVYFRSYRYLGKLLNLFNFISVMDHLWHMGDRYLVTRTPDRMLRHLGRVQMDTTYMGMFWGKALWLVVSVVCGVGSWALDPQRGFEAVLDPGVEWARPVCDQLARESHYGLNHIEMDPPSFHHLWCTITSMPIILSCIYHKISNISHTKSKNLNVSRLGLQLSLRNKLKPSVKWRMKM